MVGTLDSTCLCTVPGPVGSFPGGSAVQNPPANAGDTGDTGLTPGLGTFPGGGNGNLLQYSCLENSMGGGAWWATVYGVIRVGHD